MTAKDAQSEASSVKKLMDEFFGTEKPPYPLSLEEPRTATEVQARITWENNYKRLREDLEAKINRLILEARIEELKWADDKFDSLLQATEDGDRVHPGEYFEAIEDRIKELSKQLGEK